MVLRLRARKGIVMAKTLVWKFAEAVDYHCSIEKAAEALGLDVASIIEDANDVPCGVKLMDGSSISQLSNGDWEHLSNTGKRIGRYHETK